MSTLICLGGLFGSGRTVLAREFAARKGFHHRSVNDHKLRAHVRGTDGAVRERILQPMTDEERTFVYDRVLAELPLISKMHTHVVVDDTFSRKKPREHFLQKAREYFDHVIFVWVDSPPEFVMRRLERLYTLGLIPNAAAGISRRTRAEEQYEDVGLRTLRFVHTDTDPSALEELWGIITSANVGQSS